MISLMLRTSLVVNKKLSEFYKELLSKMFGFPSNFGPSIAWHDFYKTLENTLKSQYECSSKPIRILEIGAGKYSAFTEAQKEKYSLHITGLDISFEELKSNEVNDNMIIYDAINPNYETDLKEYCGKFDLAVSKMFLEHINDPEITHKLIAYCLKPGGKVIHFHPTLYDPAFFLNTIIPRKLAKKLVEHNDSSRKQVGVFPAYYRNCRAINNKLIRFFKSCGFDFSNERHYYGADYFTCMFPIYILILPFLLLMCYLDLKSLSAYSLVCLEKSSYS